MDDRQQALTDAIILIFNNATELSLQLDIEQNEADAQKNTHAQEDA